MDTIQKLQEQRADLGKKLIALQTKIDAENRSMTGEERQEFDRMAADVHKMRAEIEKAHAAEEQRQKDQEQREADKQRFQELESELRRTSPLKAVANIDAKGLTKRAIIASIRGGAIPDEYRSVLEKPEYRILQADIAPAGGFLTVFQALTPLVETLKDNVWIRQLAKTETIREAQSLGVPVWDGALDDASWLSETGTAPEDANKPFSKRELHPQRLAKFVNVSLKLLRMASDVESVVMERMAYIFGITEEKAFLTGNGVGQPLGVFTASTDGISTGRDVQSGSATDITWDGIINTRNKLKGSYRANAKWVTSNDGLSKMMKIKDSSNRYIWNPSVNGSPYDTIYNNEVIVSEYCPNTFTSGKYVAMFADFSKYTIADANASYFKRCEEKNIEKGQIGFLWERYVDGMPILEEAFARMITN